MTLPKIFLSAALTFALLALTFFVFSSRHQDKTAATILSPVSWQHMAMPGNLSQAHAFLQNNCAACHTPVKGVEPTKCIVCHADNKSLLQRQPTAFHANITSCMGCHFEHHGRSSRITEMDHVTLAHIGFKELESKSRQEQLALAEITRWVKEARNVPQMTLPHLKPEENLLNCAACHQTKDVHRGFFGMDCAQCHGTAKWTIAEFRHPSSSSQSCAQCHQAPPSHYMMHFKMISMTVARQEHATVHQCFLCHQTTSWNDIKGIGFYKHH